MRWLLIAAMLFLPLTFACTSDSGDSTTTDGTTESAGFECKTCDKTSDTAKDCCGAPMSAL